MYLPSNGSQIGTDLGRGCDFFEVRIWTVSKSDGNCGMADVIVQTPENVTLLGAGEASKAILDTALAIAPYLVAADGGAELALKCGRTPNNIIGDLDSVNKATLAKIPANRRHKLSEQDSTDFDKCLRNIDSPLILGVGFLGRRIDHQLAALNSLVGYSRSHCILLGADDLVFHLNGALELDLEPRSRISLFALQPVKGTSDGLEWPINGIEFAPGGLTGTSNRVGEGRVFLDIDGPGMLVILPPDALQAVVSAMVAR